MTHRNLKNFLSRGITGGIALGLAATGLLAGAGVSSADPVSLTLNYSCEFPLIGAQPIKVTINTDIPKSVEVGKPSPEFVVKTESVVPAGATAGLGLVGAKTIEGKADANVEIAAPEATLPLVVPAVIPKTDVPAEGEFTVPADGKAPSITAKQAGEAKITIGDLKLTLTPRTADGAETGLGTFESPCKQEQGQNNVLATIQITGGAAPAVAPRR